MLYARDAQGRRVRATSGARATCPFCGRVLLARCGEIRVWHWAHEVATECDTWAESETSWHLAWKDGLPPERVEVVQGEHRADAVAEDGTVIELQHSPISLADILAREAHYGQMVWVLDGFPFQDNFRVEIGPQGARFHWAHPHVAWLQSTKPKFIHGFTLGRLIRRPNPYQRGQTDWGFHALNQSDALFQITRWDLGRQVAGEGRMITVDRFRARFWPSVSFELG